MESAVKVNKSWENKIKGVIHEDHTSRIQVVSKKQIHYFETYR